MTHRLVLVLAAVLIYGCSFAPFPIPAPSGAQYKSPDVSAYSKQQKDQAEVDKEKNICREWATKSTDHDPDIMKEWLDTWIVEPVQKFFLIETAQEKWNRFYGTCMEARGYVVK